MSDLNEKLAQVRQQAAAYNRTLLATDPRFRRAVQVRHHDGSSFDLNHAFLMRQPVEGHLVKEWVICFSEHLDPLVWCSEDLASFRQMCTPPIEMFVTEDPDSV